MIRRELPLTVSTNGPQDLANRLSLYSQGFQPYDLKSPERLE